MAVRRSKRRRGSTTATRFSARKQAVLQQRSLIYGTDYGILPSVKASIIPRRVPLGFVCGYPLPGGGELYGGSMFARSAAMDTLQGKAIHAINVKWGGASPKASNAASSNNNNNSNSRRSGSGSAVSSGEGGGILSGGGGIKAGGGQQAPGRETIGIAVCKKKYKPFQFRVLKERGGVKVAVAERLYACQCHHAARKAVIEQHGVRQGWQPFGVWSLRKAQEQARLETIRLNNNLQCVAISDTTLIKGSKKNASLTSISNDGDSSTDTEETDTEVSYSNTKVPETAILRKSLSSVCLNGACTWKVESAYDDIYKEMHGCTESEAEENESKGRQGWYM